jgi:superfamily II DNA/RNA helicase
MARGSPSQPGPRVTPLLRSLDDQPLHRSRPHPRPRQDLTALGQEEPTPILSQSIPPLLAGRDLLGQAATGTGKTATFALPLLQRVLAKKGTHAHSPHPSIRCLPCATKAA